MFVNIFFIPAQNSLAGDCCALLAPTDRKETRGQCRTRRPMSKMNYLLALVPISWALVVFHAPSGLAFFVIAAAVVPLAAIIGRSTEELAKRTGSTIGALLNATFGNLTELILVIIAVKSGHVLLVRASLIGSIMGNILLVMGLSLFLGGLKHRVQKFNHELAGMHAQMLFLAVGGMLVPTLFREIIPYDRPLKWNTPFEEFSLAVSAVLITVYIGSLVFSLRTHEDLFRGGEPPHDPPKWTTKKSSVILLIASVMVAVQSELLVHSFEPATQALGLSEMFVGMIIIPVIGNAAEHASAITFAMRNQMDISMNICTSSSTQIAMLVAPLAVLISPLLGHPMGLDFTLYELAAVGFGVLTAAFVSWDGRCNWFEGAQLLSVYLVLALAFYFVK